MWFQMQIEHALNEDIEQISEQLTACGAVSVMLSDKNNKPVFEPVPDTTPLWPEMIIQALFDHAADAQHAQEQLTAGRPSLQFSLETIEDQDWQRVCMDDFKPQRFGERLWICPTWLTPPEPTAVNLMLDPGLAFGTGTHPTTTLCLTWLEQAALTQKSVIDYGCGSGILALAALKLGAQPVYAVDIDNQALEATQNNALTNEIEQHHLTVSMPEALQEPVDLIIANILLTPLISLKYRFHELLKQDAVLVVSGLLAEQAPMIIEAYAASFTPIAQQTLDGWSLLVFSRI
ncbi:MAG: 50S ribosomal protein L11 methyltransferase [Legionellales bacterium]